MIGYGIEEVKNMKFYFKINYKAVANVTAFIFLIYLYSSN